MSPDPATIDHDALRLMLEVARRELLTAFYAKQEADRRYMEAFVAYEEAANTLRRTLTVVELPTPRAILP
ncbi:MAG: hypothetical protein ACRYGP_08160 [Janthinobacterium lividum]